VNRPLLQVGTLKLRHEGSWWVAYYMMPGEPPMELARIDMRLVHENEPRRQQFMLLAKDVTADFIEAATGIRPVMGSEGPAPESERAGHA
jgi:hypothetical protein